MLSSFLETSFSQGPDAAIASKERKETIFAKLVLLHGGVSLQLLHLKETFGWKFAAKKWCWGVRKKQQKTKRQKKSRYL